MSTNNLIIPNLNETKRIFDYFVITGLPPKLTAKNQIHDEFQPLSTDEHERLLFKNIELEAHHLQHDKILPIVDIAVLNRTLNEGIPNGYECLWKTPAGNSANLCCESSIMFTKQTEMYLLIKRGVDRPPITDIGVYYEGTRERVLDDCTVIRKTIGDNNANLNTSSFNTEQVFITYRRATEIACNSLAVIDICLIVKKKESAPHSFNVIPKDLNRGMIGSSVYLCYKKAWIPAPQIKYTPTILYRYPQTDHIDLPFPNEIAPFGLPMGAVIESWPISLESTSNNIYLSNLKPIFSTFVLNVNSDDGIINEKVYGSSITFYEDFNESYLSEEQSLLLNYQKNDTLKIRSLHSNKSLIILSRHPFFETFKNFLVFLFNKYTKKLNIKTGDLIIPIERYLSHLIYDVPFPTHQKPHVLINLTDNEQDCLSVNLPNELILPQSGASFTELIRNLGVENSINVFLFVLLQRNVMIHSLRRQVLTSVVEAISCIIFPFVWRYSYIPMCPLSLCQLIEAPGSFIIGMDTRFFDMFDPPQNVFCVDLDTNTISWTPDRQSIHSKILPKKVYNMLKNKLSQISGEVEQISEAKIKLNNTNESNKRDIEAKLKKREQNLDLLIREIFLKSMGYILYNYKNFLRTVTRRPDTKAIDRNLSKFFDCEGFWKSKEASCQYFYKELIKTQLFYDCIMNLTFASELDQALADSFGFFAEMCSKLNPQLNKDEDIRLLDFNESSNSQTVVILPPSLDSDFLSLFNPDLLLTNNNDIINKGSAFLYDEVQNSFPKLKVEVLINANSNANSSVDLNISNSNQHLNGNINNNNSNDIIPSRKNSFQSNDPNKAETQSISSANAQNQFRRQIKVPSTPVGVRTKAEKAQALKKIESELTFKFSTNQKQNEKNKHLAAKLHAFYFLSNAYALWFIYLPEYLKDCGEFKKNGLNYAYQVLTQMQKHNLIQPDEFCYRIIMQLCLTYNFPTLAVKTLLHIRKYNIQITPITYSYYNKALIEASNWPTFEQDRWAKLRLLILVTGKFKYHLKLKKERELKNKTKRSSKTLKKKKQKIKTIKSNKNTSKINSSLNNTPQKTDNDRFENRYDSKLKDSIEKLNGIQIREQDLIEPSIKNNGIIQANDEKIFNSNVYYKQNSTKRHSKHSESDRHEKTILRASKNPNLEKFNKLKLNFNATSIKHNLVLNSSGILILSSKFINSQLPINKKATSTNSSLKRKFTSLETNLNTLKSPIKVTFLEEINKSTSQLSKKSFQMTPITINDPLGAFSTPLTIEHNGKSSRINENDEIKNKLFYYKPFEENESNKSDFVYGQSKYQPSSMVVKQNKQNDNISYDSDLQSDDDYDDSDEDEEEDDEDDDYEYDEENSDDYDDEQSDNSSIGVDEKYLKKKNRDNDSYDLKSADKLSIQDKEKISEDRLSSKGSIKGTIDFENNSRKETPNLINGNLNEDKKMFSSPFSPLFNPRFTSLFKKVENSIGTTSQTLIQASKELRDVILSNTNQQELTNKFKSISNYQIKTPQYLNGLVKSTSTLTKLNSNQSNFNGDRTKKSDSFSSQINLDTDNINTKYICGSLDLEPLANDDSYKPLSLNWWGIDKNIENGCSEPLVDIQISSCNYCENCKSFLYDEEIMSGWTLKDSDLNIKCLHCNASLVPNLYIKIQDHDNIRKYIIKDDNSDTNANEQQSEKSHPFLNLENSNSKESDSSDKNKSSIHQINLNTNEFTVQYLSPIVVRKELENIITNNCSQEIEEKSFIDETFMNEHKIIFWNLIWYFKRIGVDSGHLATILLNDRIKLLKAQLKENSEFDEFKFKNFIPNQSTKVYTQHPNVIIKCMWDNLKLQNDITYHEVPLYISWLIKNYSNVQNKMKNRMVTILSQNELKLLRNTTANPENKLYDLIIRNIRESEVIVPFKNLLRERICSKINYASIYREILYLVLIALERDLIDIDAFDTEYREAYKNLKANEAKDLIKLSDKPPNNVAVWCRRLFSPLLI